MAGAMTGMPSMAPSSAPMSSPMGGPSPYARGGAAPVDPEETSNKQYVLAAVIGVVFAVMIGTGSFLIWKSQEIRREQAKPATSVSASVSASASASASNAVAANRDIAFTISPPEAKISIDGTELDATIRAVPRPPAGTTVPVVVHAPGYEDQTSLIDYFTASPLEVSLKPAPEATPTATPTAEPPPPTVDPPTVDPPKGDPPKGDDTATPPKPRPKPSAKSDPVLPPNPF
jgi:hypothetical protein